MILPSYECVLYQHGGEETLFHLLLGCPFAQECWIHVQFFMEVIIIMCWSIWMARNDWIFKGIAPSVQDSLFRFKTIFTHVILRVKEDWKQQISSWLEQTL
uniref:Reverse transcriptase zinc-binding domain-containing protein n=1 Tax=Setaria viridis TaxID=4556 RepID=A0A4U6VK16_SETVI|nr:hypothetical protein SEVIR_2G001800v2 [Setaria viridis]